jgi:phospholipase C
MSEELGRYLSSYIQSRVGVFKFRMKIWDKTTGKTVYDNNLGYPENIEPTTETSGGNVDVHIKRPEK